MMYDVVIIGAGQAGLSIGYYLKKAEVSFLLLDKSTEIGASWRSRYDSLKLFTPRSYSTLPGLQLTGNENSYPNKDEIADYLVTYANTYTLPVQLNTVVEELTQLSDGSFTILTNNGTYLTKQVVVATGPFQAPHIPSTAANLSQEVLQLHSSEYQNSNQLIDGDVLVVGGGNSGAQIAVELSKERRVFLSVGHKMVFLPQDIGNKSIFSYFDKLGIYRASTDSFIGKWIRSKPDPIFGYELKGCLQNGKVIQKPRTTAIYNDNTIGFEDGSTLSVKNVIWSTGFRSDYSWMKMKNMKNILNSTGNPIHTRGVSNVKGLYFLGLPWQSSRGSALLQGVGADAEYILNQIILTVE
ncbi:SidA/IucD/PvdA family monooxygenase [Bacillus sp. BGMRC 2118]|nr:SidA/IucD/PvdA family monooxygenase [Bacillus sp. BGMRC 2118]